jgi:hypothetical protein
VTSTIIGEFGLDPHQMCFPIRAALKRNIGNPDHTRPSKPLKAHHLTQSRSGKHFKAHERTHGITRQAENRGSIQQTECEWFRRLDRNLHPLHVSDSSKHRLHNVVITHRHAATRHHDVIGFRSRAKHTLKNIFIVSHGAKIGDLAAGITQRNGQHPTIALSNLARLERSPIVNEFIAR